MNEFKSFKCKYEYNGGTPDETWGNRKKYTEDEWEISSNQCSNGRCLILTNLDLNFKQLLSITSEQYSNIFVEKNVNEYLKIACQLNIEKLKTIDTQQ